MAAVLLRCACYFFVAASAAAFLAAVAELRDGGSEGQALAAAPGVLSQQQQYL